MMKKTITATLAAVMMMATGAGIMGETPVTNLFENSISASASTYVNNISKLNLNSSDYVANGTTKHLGVRNIVLAKSGKTVKLPSGRFITAKGPITTQCLAKVVNSDGETASIRFGGTGDYTGMKVVKFYCGTPTTVNVSVDQHKIGQNSVTMKVNDKAYTLKKDKTLNGYTCSGATVKIGNKTYKGVTLNYYDVGSKSNGSVVKYSGTKKATVNANKNHASFEGGQFGYLVNGGAAQMEIVV